MRFASTKQGLASANIVKYNRKWTLGEWGWAVWGGGGVNETHRTIPDVAKRSEGTKTTNKTNYTGVLGARLLDGTPSSKTLVELFFFVFFCTLQAFCNLWIGFIGFISTVVAF